MSYLDTKQALIQQLLTVPGVSDTDIAFENQSPAFDPEGKDFYLAAFFIPATTEMMGKTPESSDEQRGIFQVSVYVPLVSSSYDNEQLQKIDDVLSVFQYNTTTVYNGQRVDILSSTVNAGTEIESWHKRDISINYLTFSVR